MHLSIDNWFCIIMEYLGEIELENNYKRICDALMSNSDFTDFTDFTDFENFGINENIIWFICYKKNIPLLKKICSINPEFKKLVFDAAKEKNMNEFLKWCSRN